MIHKSDLRSVLSDDITPDLALFLGETLFLAGEILEAKKTLDNFIVQNERDSKKYREVSYALDLMGQCHFVNEDFALAKGCYEKATGLNPDCEYAHHNLGILYTKLSDAEIDSDFEKGCEWFYLANNSFNESLMLNSENPYFLHSKAIWHQKYTKLLDVGISDQGERLSTIVKNFQLAINQYLKSMKFCTENDADFKDIVCSNLVECFMQCGHHLFHYAGNNYQCAQKMYYSALRLNPNHLAATHQMGVTFCNQHNFVKAREYFSNIFKITKDKNVRAHTWLNIASTYRLEKSWADAKNAIDSALILAPNNTWIRAEREVLRKAMPRTHQSMFSALNPVSNEESSEDEGRSFKLSGSH